MTRLHADDVDVQRGMVDISVGSGVGRIEGPAQFHWGRRSYVVHAVLDHWMEAGNWWRRAGRPRAGPGGMAGATGTAGGIDDGEREMWRVEARQVRAGRDAPLGVFDLRFDWSAGRWSLIRVHD